MVISFNKAKEMTKISVEELAKKIEKKIDAEIESRKNVHSSTVVYVNRKEFDFPDRSLMAATVDHLKGIYEKQGWKYESSTRGYGSVDEITTIMLSEGGDASEPKERAIAEKVKKRIEEEFLGIEI